MKAVFLRVIDAGDKASAIISAIAAPPSPKGSCRFEVDPRSLKAVPRSPFAYWLSDRVRGLFVELGPFESDGRSVRQGLATADDHRFVRAWWAVSAHTLGRRWYPFAKGGRFSPYYADLPVCVNWQADGAEVATLIKPGSDRPASRVQNVDWYLRPGITWPLRGVRFSAQAVPAGSVFSIAGKMAFSDRADLPHLVALFNSLVFDRFIAVFAGERNVQYEVGLIQSVPYPALTSADEAALAALARRAWSQKRVLDGRAETSHSYILPALLQVVGETLTARAAAWRARVGGIDDALAAIQAEIDRRCFELYGIDDEDRRAITEGVDDGVVGSETSEGDADAEDDGESEPAADTTTLTAELVSWAVGVAIGRFDVRLATGERTLPGEPEPFDPLPVSSPAMLTGEDGMPVARPPAAYPLSFQEDGILVDDAGHPRDLTAAVRAVFEVVFGSSADAVWQETAARLDPRSHDLRRWLASGFFEHHLRRHMKSRRKAPVLWQLGVPSGRYSVWCHAHRMTQDSMFIVQNDVLAPKLSHEERRLSSLTAQAGQIPSPKERAEIAAQESLVAELRTLAAEVRRVAPLWHPDLDDGIVLVIAPLWRLVPGHKPWQKELHAKWNELAAGKYDWAHLAMSLWPERVIPKCAVDRNLAIAHGLEDVFWAEGRDAKWARHPSPSRSVDDLVAERASTAVKAALTDLLDSPRLAAGGGRRDKNSARSV